MSIVLKISCTLLLMTILQVKNCSTGEKQLLDAAQYIAWVENPDNGLFVTKQMNDIVYSLQYKPHQYEAMLQEKRPMSDAEMKSEVDSLSDMQYYTFRIGTLTGADVQRYNLADDNEYYARLEYFALQMEKDIQLIDGQDTLPCLLFHFERTYGIDPRATFVLAFDAKKKSSGNKTLMYTDRAFGSGPVLLTINASDLAEIPELYLSE